MVVKLRAGRLERGTKSSAGWDLFSTIACSIHPGERRPIPVGVKTAWEGPIVGMIRDKSGHALKAGITVLGGVIDGDYPDEWQVILLNTGTEVFHVSVDQKVAQVLFLSLADAHVLPLGTGRVTVKDDERTGGFGSTGDMSAPPVAPEQGEPGRMTDRTNYGVSSDTDQQAD